jgi:hypothetical protein
MADGCHLIPHTRTFIPPPTLQTLKCQITTSKANAAADKLVRLCVGADTGRLVGTGACTLRHAPAAVMLMRLLAQVHVAQSPHGLHYSEHSASSTKTSA